MQPHPTPDPAGAMWLYVAFFAACLLIVLGSHWYNAQDGQMDVPIGDSSPMGTVSKDVKGDTNTCHHLKIGWVFDRFISV